MLWFWRLKKGVHSSVVYAAFPKCLEIAPKDNMGLLDLFGEYAGMCVCMESCMFMHLSASITAGWNLQWIAEGVPQKLDRASNGWTPKGGSRFDHFFSGLSQSPPVACVDARNQAATFKIRQAGERHVEYGEWLSKKGKLLRTFFDAFPELFGVINNKPLWGSQQLQVREWDEIALHCSSTGIVATLCLEQILCTTGQKNFLCVFGRKIYYFCMFSRNSEGKPGDLFPVKISSCCICCLPRSTIWADTSCEERRISQHLSH